MRRNLRSGPLVPFDPEINKTLRLRKRLRFEETQVIEVVEMAERRSLRDYAAPNAQGVHSSITRPAIDANNFEIKPAFISMLQQNQFGGSPMEDPNIHLSLFHELCDTIKINGVSDDALKLRLFPFTLRNRARDWLHSQPSGMFTTWELLSNAFLMKYFPPSKTIQLRNQITGFAQKEGESLSEAWERYNELQRKCPHHGLEQWVLIETFYYALLNQTRLTVDAAAGGAFMNKTLDEAYQMIEEMALNQEQNSRERGVIYRPPHGKDNGNDFRTLAEKVESLCNRFDTFKMQTHAISSSVTCEICGNHGHVSEDCKIIVDRGEEQVNSLGSYNQSRSYDPYSNTYNPGWRNHPNLSWKSNNHDNGQNKNRGFQQRQSNQSQTQKSSLEEMLTEFMGFQKKQSDEMNERLKRIDSSMNERMNQMDSRIDGIIAHNKILESQIAQQASTSYRPPGKLPSKPEPNPREYCNAIMTRSGKQLEEPKGEVENNRKEPSLDHDKDCDFEKSTEHEQSHDSLSPHKDDEPKGDLPCKDDNSKSNSHSPYKPPIPFPQRIVQAKLDRQFGKFLEVLKKLYINIPLIDAISQMPTYAKFLKEILSNKRKIEDYGTVALTEECSAIIQNKLLPKLKDPGSFSVPCSIGSVTFDRALCDLGASVSLIPLSVCRKLNIGELKPTSMSLQLADSTVKYPVGILENVPVQIGKFFIPADFIVLDMEENLKNPIILGRPFLATAGALIDVKKGKLTFDICGDLIEFDLTDSLKRASHSGTCCSIETIDEEVVCDMHILFEEPSEFDTFSECANQEFQERAAKKKKRRRRGKGISKLLEEVKRLINKFGYCFKFEPYVLKSPERDTEKSGWLPKIQSRSNLSVERSS